MKRMILIVLVLSHTASANGLALDDHFTNGVVLDNDGIGGDWIIIQQDPPWTTHDESGTEVTIYDGPANWSICGIRNADSYAVGQTARITLTGIEYDSGSSRADRGNGVQAAISVQFTVADYTNGASFPSGYQNDGKPALNCEINYDPNTERIGFCLRYSNMSHGSDTVYSAKAFDASTTELGPNTPLIIEMIPKPDSTCLVWFNWSYDGGKTETLSVPMSNNSTPLTDGLFLVAVGTQGVGECNGSVTVDRVEVFEVIVLPKTVYVDLTNAGDPCADGSPDHPFWRIQDGINAAVNGDEVVVADGTYTGVGNRDIDFGGRLITLRGENGPETCIIDCELAAGGLLFTSGESELAVVQGFAIQNCSGLGGGVYIENSSPTVVNCRFINNRGLISGAILTYTSRSRIMDCVFIGNTAGPNPGGGIYCAQYSNPTVVNCKFFSNSAVDGGGIFCMISNLTIIGCIFAGNTAEYNGGGLHHESGHLKATDCVFAGNRASRAGGGISVHFGSAYVNGCHFIGNAVTAVDHSWDGGGAMRNYWTTNVSVESCLFSANYALCDTYVHRPGGAIHNYDAGTVTITGCLFAGNAATGDMTVRKTCAGVRNAGSTSSIVSNCTLADNDAGFGGTAGVVGGIVSNCIVWNPSGGRSEVAFCNVTYSDLGIGTDGIGTINLDPNFVGGLSGTFTDGGLYNTNEYTVTLTDANANWIPGELVGRFIRPFQGLATVQGNRRIVFPIVSNTADTVTVWADAKTIEDANSWIGGSTGYGIRDYHLTPDSPCIDTGDPNYVPGPNETDLDDMPRLVDGDCNDTVRVDMGAYEFNYAYMGDFDYQCDVDFDDHAILGSAWQTAPDDTEWNALCDISVPADGYIDWRDVAILCENWLAEFGR